PDMVAPDTAQLSLPLLLEHYAVHIRDIHVMAGAVAAPGDADALLPREDAVPVPPVDRPHGPGVDPHLRQHAPVPLLHDGPADLGHRRRHRPADRRARDEDPRRVHPVGAHRGDLLQVVRAGAEDGGLGRPRVGPGRTRASARGPGPNEGGPVSDQAPRRGPVLPPIAYPVLGLVFGGILVYSFSRVLLAVKKDWAPVIGVLMALNVLVGAALVAYGSRVRRRPASFPLLVGAAAGVIGIGVLALNLNEQPVAKAQGGGPGVVSVALAAQNIAFDKKQLTMPAGAKVTLSFDNKDSGVPHNFALFSDQAATQVVFR